MYFVNLLKLIPFAADVINTALSQYTADRINSFDHHWSKTKKTLKLWQEITNELQKSHKNYAS